MTLTRLCCFSRFYNKLYLSMSEFKNKQTYCVMIIVFLLYVNKIKCAHEQQTPLNLMILCMFLNTTLTAILA